MNSGYVSFQAVIFFAGFSKHANAAKLWSDVIDSPYESFQSPIPNVTIASGRVGNLMLELHHQPERYDVIVRLFDDTPGPPRTTTDLSLLSATAIQTVQAASRDVAVVRLAGIASSTSEGRDLQHVQSLMVEAVPGLPVAPNTTDQLFQANSPFSSVVQPALQYNRLARWNLAMGFTVLFQIGPGGPEPMPSSEPVWALQTMVDINTLLPTRPDPSLIEQLFNEIVGEAEEVTVGGYPRLV